LHFLFKNIINQLRDNGDRVMEPTRAGEGAMPTPPPQPDEISQLQATCTKLLQQLGVQSTIMPPTARGLESDIHQLTQIEHRLKLPARPPGSILIIPPPPTPLPKPLDLQTQIKDSKTQKITSVPREPTLEEMAILQKKYKQLLLKTMNIAPGPLPTSKEDLNEYINRLKKVVQRLEGWKAPVPHERTTPSQRLQTITWGPDVTTHKHKKHTQSQFQHIDVDKKTGQVTVRKTGQVIDMDEI
jgi:hypothetical protein